MALYSELPVYRDSYRLLMEIYKVTNTFAREYKFSLGQDMRRDTLSLFRNLYRANKSTDTITMIAGYEGILCGLSAIYSAMGQIVNAEYGKTIIPLG